MSVFHELEVGDTHESHGRTITEADVVNFAGVSGDHNHVHLDADTMAESHYGERIAHGMLVLSAATGLVWQTRTVKERNAVVAFYGIDHLRFRAPVFFGDTIHIESEVIEKEEKPDSPGTGTVRYALDVKVGEETVISCEMLSLLE
ncbi:MaoC/PaaZ C-terminal domain-containing protein [Natronomonas sp. EA1]|uniref:MaoC/PaaZ C-terminal domain-containing protein n=1 Tax=Natronomonas sp. EA1 TaxID=3421655 RepID=UPI003EBC3EE6